MQIVAPPRFGVFFDQPPPLSLYIHFPWCVRKCPYCDFNSHEFRSTELPEQAYLKAFEADLHAALPSVWGRRIETIFIGGGTPSLLSADGLDQILTLVRTLLPVHVDAEITMEANPGTVEVERFKGYRAAGINRVSLGIQSFNPRHLAALGRIHNAEEALRAATLAQEIFPRVNLDLMYALPEQTLEEALEDLDTALNLGTTHLSCYQLTLEPNTPFHRHPPPLPNTDEAAEMGDAITQRLEQSGFKHYETSAYAKPGAECLHNLNYWSFGDYLGLGPGAHGKLSYRDHVVREVRHRHPRAWMEAIHENKSPLQSSDRVKDEDLPFEFAMNAFRLTEGFSLELFKRRTGLPLQRFLPTLDALELKGLVKRDTQHVIPTELGCRFLNDLIQAFLRDA
jgi:putative oxygen-independent coproporphyrinogen III oxidase